jgi:hypothetical protein
MFKWGLKKGMQEKIYKGFIGREFVLGNLNRPWSCHTGCPLVGKVWSMPQECKAFVLEDGTSHLEDLCLLLPPSTQSHCTLLFTLRGDG